MVLEQKEILAFNAIANFMKALTEEFTKDVQLAMFNRLIEHMNLTHETQIRRVVTNFETYLRTNYELIKKSDIEMEGESIMYNEQVTLKIKNLFKEADSATRSVMFQHLLTIYGILHPDAGAKECLKSLQEKKANAENELITTLMDKISPHVKPGDETNPMNAIMGLMSSGVFSELMETMDKSVKEGNLDINGLVSKITTMMPKDPTEKLPPKIEEEK